MICPCHKIPFCGEECQELFWESFDDEDEEHCTEEPLIEKPPVIPIPPPVDFIVKKLYYKPENARVQNVNFKI